MVRCLGLVESSMVALLLTRLPGSSRIAAHPFPDIRAATYRCILHTIYEPANSWVMILSGPKRAILAVSVSVAPWGYSNVLP